MPRCARKSYAAHPTLAGCLPLSSSPRVQGTQIQDRFVCMYVCIYIYIYIHAYVHIYMVCILGVVVVILGIVIDSAFRHLEP